MMGIFTDDRYGCGGGYRQKQMSVSACLFLFSSYSGSVALFRSEVSHSRLLCSPSQDSTPKSYRPLQKQDPAFTHDCPSFLGFLDFWSRFRFSLLTLLSPRLQSPQPNSLGHRTVDTLYVPVYETTHSTPHTGGTTLHRQQHAPSVTLSLCVA